MPNYRFPASVEATAYFVVSEALTNVARHAGTGRARVALTITTGGRMLEVTVADNGTGRASAASGIGLRGLADRVALLDGTLDVVSRTGRHARARPHPPAVARVWC
jgi:signal transduction histidine kinase